MVLNRVGLDLGPADGPAPLDARLAAAAELGARWVRLRFALDAGRAVDDAFVAAARTAVDAAAARRLRVLGVIDGALTVAPDALAAEDATLAAAVADELVEHAGRLAAALGDAVAAWEIVPAPNAAAGRRGPLDPARWATLLAAAGAAVRAAAPRATVVAGGLASTADDDAVDYLRAAVEAGRWAVGTPPFDGLGLQLRLLPAGGADEAEVAAAVAERTGRLWRAAAAALGRHAPDVRGLWVTGLSWDAEQAGDAAQARNLFTAYDTLTADPCVQAVFWTSLVDDGAATGLVAAADLDRGAARLAWKAFHDFGQYARQISPPPVVLLDPSEHPAVGGPGAAEGEAAVGGPVDAGGAAVVDAPGDGVAADARADIAAASAASELDGVAADAEPRAANATVDAAPAPPSTTIRFHVPTVAELLAAAGVPADALPAALDAVATRHGARDALPPGDYAVDVPGIAAPSAASLGGGSSAGTAGGAAAHRIDLNAPVATAPAATGAGAPAAHATPPSGPTNQLVLSAFYRAGGGSWALLQRAGLDLADLVSQRDAAYGGPAIAQMEALSPAERAAVLGEMGGGA